LKADEKGSVQAGASGVGVAASNFAKRAARLPGERQTNERLEVEAA